MMKLTEHLETVDENYFEHAGHALKFSITLAIAAVVCFIHAIFPFLFEKTGSNIIKKLYDSMVTHRLKKDKQN